MQKAESETPQRSLRVVEVLAVLLIIGALIGLLVPAVMRVRAAAARTTCAGHFCMWAVSLHNYADRHDGALPPGALPHPGLPPDQRLSWLVPMMAGWISMDHVLNEFDLTRGPGDPRNEKPASNRFRHFVCPASGECTRDGSGESWKSPAPLTHYVGVAGVGPDAATLPLGHPRAGAFGYDRRTALKDGFADGKSNTLMLIETGMNPGHWAYGGTATVRAFEREPAYIGPGRPFGGFHNGAPVIVGTRTNGCNVAFADGSGRYLTSKTDPTVLEALATVGGKEELPANW